MRKRFLQLIKAIFYVFLMFGGFLLVTFVLQSLFGEDNAEVVLLILAGVGIIYWVTRK
jgi:hypothetical protein